jgi:hypothetical protein
MSDLWLLPGVRKVAGLAETVTTVFIETVENRIHMSTKENQSKSPGAKKTLELSF